MGVVVRACDHCGSAIRPDAVACGNCGQESEPWIEYKKLWWVQRDGAWLYLDEKQNTWQVGTVAPEVEEEMRNLKDQVFTSSLTGQARAAWEAGQQVHQVVIPLLTASRTVSGFLSGNIGGQVWGGIKTTANSGHSFEIPRRFGHGTHGDIPGHDGSARRDRRIARRERALPFGRGVVDA